MASKSKLSHTDSRGKIKMVDVTPKTVSHRIARASGKVFLNSNAFKAVKENTLVKGDVLSTAQIAGTSAAKKTSELIPLCHNIFLSNVSVELKMNTKSKSIDITAEVKTNSVTGVEMEALTAVSVAALTIYDMCKAIDKSIKISEILLEYKSGGKSGTFKRRK